LIDRLRALAPQAVDNLECHVQNGDQIAAVRLLRLIVADRRETKREASAADDRR
jgi:hypothetical protein